MLERLRSPIKKHSETATKPQPVTEKAVKEKLASELRVDHPNYYDFTENEVLIIPKHRFVSMLRNKFWQGAKTSALFGSLSVGLTVLAALVAAENFQETLGLTGDVWRAIFVISFIIAIVSVISFAVIVIRDWRKNGESAIRDLFFTEDRKVKKNKNAKK